MLQPFGLKLHTSLPLTVNPLQSDLVRHQASQTEMSVVVIVFKGEPPPEHVLVKITV